VFFLGNCQYGCSSLVEDSQRGGVLFIAVLIERGYKVLESWGYLKNGIIKENPILVLMLGLCPALAVSSSANDAMGMSIAVMIVLVASNVMVSAVSKYTPEQIRIPVYIIIISTFVTIVDMSMHAFDPELYKNLGVFVPLIVVNCVVLGRSEAFAAGNSVLNSLLDALGMSIGFCIVIVAIGAIREILGNGTITLFNTVLVDMGEGYNPMLLMIMPPGAFMVIGFLIAFKKRYIDKV